MKTEELIVQLTRSLEPVQPLARPSVRLMRWSALSLAIGTVGVLAIGARGDLVDAVRQPAFVALAILALATGVAAAAYALVLSVPGAERSPVQRAGPLMLCVAWALMLTAMLVSGGSATARLMAPPVHIACVIEIGGFALITGWVLFAMLRRAAPLELTWSAALAALAATAFGAAATQIVCPIDDPAHHLVGHMVPRALFTAIGAAAWRQSLNKLSSF